MPKPDKQWKTKRVREDENTELWQLHRRRSCHYRGRSCVYTHVHADVFSRDIRLNHPVLQRTQQIHRGNANAACKRQLARQMRRQWVVLIMPDDGSYEPPYVGKAASLLAKVTHRVQFKWHASRHREYSRETCSVTCLMCIQSTERIISSVFIKKNRLRDDLRLDINKNIHM